MKTKNLFCSAFVFAALTFTVQADAVETAAEQSTAPTSDSTTTNPPTNGENSTGVCWVWPGCIIIN